MSNGGRHRQGPQQRPRPKEPSLTPLLEGVKLAVWVIVEVVATFSGHHGN